MLFWFFLWSVISANSESSLPGLTYLAGIYRKVVFIIHKFISVLESAVCIGLFRISQVLVKLICWNMAASFIHIGTEIDVWGKIWGWGEEPCWVQGNSSGGIVPEFLGQNIFPSGFRLVHNNCGCCFCRIISFTSRLDLEFKPLSGLPFRLLPSWLTIRCQSMFVFILKCQSRDYCKVLKDNQIFFTEIT